MSSEIGLEIVAIKFVLGSFAHYDDDKERKEYIRSKINGIPHLDVYFSFTHEELGKLLLEKEKQRTEILRQTGAASSATAGGDASSVSSLKFEDLLATKLERFNSNVVSRCRKRFSSLILQAVTEQNGELAEEIYNKGLALPQTNTEFKLAIEGFKIDGPWHDCCDNLTICFKGSVPHLLKLLTTKECERGLLFSETLGDQRNPYLTYFEFHCLNEKKFMTMPYYASSLEMIVEIDEVVGKKLFHQLHSAIEFIHGLGFNHMDIKPSNICIRENGDFVLVDLGSIVRKGTFSDSTTVYVPIDFQPDRNGSRFLADDRNDWLMLGMTIAEMVYSLKVGCGASRPLTIDGLKEYISTRDTDSNFAQLLSLM